MPTFKPRVFRQIPETVRAVQWQLGQWLAGIIFIRPASPGKAALLPLPAHAALLSASGIVTVFAGDWIITEPSGHQHVLSSESFKLLYEPVEGYDDTFVLLARNFSR